MTVLAKTFHGLLIVCLGLTGCAGSQPHRSATPASPAVRGAPELPQVLSEALEPALGAHTTPAPTQPPRAGVNDSGPEAFTAAVETPDPSFSETVAPASAVPASATQTAVAAPIPPEPAHPQDQAALPETSSAQETGAAPPSGLWRRLRAGLRLELPDHPQVESEIQWYARNQGYLDRVAERASRYLHFVVEQVEARGMPLEIALLPVVESAYQPFAYSPGRAAGLWQFIPYTGKRYGLKQTWWYDGRRDVQASTRAALDYLEKLHADFNGDWLLALAAYNSGEGTVARAVRNNRRRGKPIDFFSLKLPRETRGYVPKLLAIGAIVAEPAKYGVSLSPIPNEPYFAAVDVGSQIDLALAADLAGLSMDDLYQLNPGFNRWATDPEGPHHLLIPADKADQFQARVAELPNKDRIRWISHRIRPGDTLSTLAARYRTTAPLIRKVNKLNGNMIRAGRTLVIPVATQRLASYSLSAEQRNSKIRATERNGHKTQYRVRSGDTLWDIAREHGVTHRQLAKWNGMAPTDTLRPDQHLVVWRKDNHESGSAALNGPAKIHTQRKIRYVVRRGDSLSRIAQRFRVTVAQLRQWNSLSIGKYLQPGQYLKLFVDITRQSGNI